MPVSVIILEIVTIVAVVVAIALTLMELFDEDEIDCRPFNEKL